jgi:hypothetical protein
MDAALRGRPGPRAEPDGPVTIINGMPAVLTGGSAARSAAALIVLALCAACGSPAPAPPPSARLASLPPRPQLFFVSVASDDTFRHVGVSRADAAGDAFYSAALRCERVHFASGRGICLQTDTVGTTPVWRAVAFDETFTVRHTVPLTGPPSRVRVSPTGRYAAATVFESGHSYAEHNFSTRTSILDLDSGANLGDLEQFQTFKDNAVFRETDFNFWGVTFARDGDTFYATLDTGGISHLVRGSVTGRTLAVLRAGVECPSLSPDNTRLAFKKRVGARSLGWWQIAILHLDTMTESNVTRETRSVDDQVEWFDDARVLYHLTGGDTAADLWSVRIDNSAAPERIRASAYSPSVVR